MRWSGPSRLGIPRTRGDGPPGWTRPRRPCGDSPHTRGWTRDQMRGNAGRDGFPAHAGMDPLAVCRRLGRRRIPRTRGDGPSHDDPTAPMDRDSPHTRGWTPPTRRAPPPPPGFPAHAGMDPDQAVRAVPARGIPRTRGDGPSRRRALWRGGEDSPHTRGWTPQFRGAVVAVPGFPAHAGMDPRRRATREPSCRIPRTRGDGPIGGTLRLCLRGDSPHTRGWTRNAWHRTGQGRGFPAHAGMEPLDAHSHPVRGRIPRTRGDGPAEVDMPSYRLVDSPHTRGWTPAAGRPGHGDDGFPAHAGMDPGRSGSGGIRPRIPRTRGDGPGASWVMLPAPTDSPHTRGWTPAPRARRPPAPGFPAHAGMDRPRRWGSRRACRIPRTRGDGPTLSSAPTRPDQDSPHTRGWTPNTQDEQSHDLGFPAHAGMDRARARRSRRRVRIPRTRGDGPAGFQGELGGTADSPHTRGWTWYTVVYRRVNGGFPAHAGMDPPPSPAPRRSSRIPRTRGDGPDR